MFYFSATQKLQAGKTIQIFNYGNCKRDFTYVDDIVEGVLRVMQGAPKKQTGEDGLPLPPYAVYNIGGGTPENLLDYISTLQEELVRAGVLPEDYDFEGMCRSLMRTALVWSVIMALLRRLGSGKGFGSLRSGIKCIMVDR